MTDESKEREIARLRLASSRLVGPPFASPVDVVRAFGAVQAQDYAGAVWALGMRLDGWTEADVDRAFDEGTILRTHVLRPTWHFVAPDDIRDLIALTGERVLRGAGSMYRRFELDAATLAKTGKVIAKQLANGRQRTRTELRDALAKAGHDVADGVRLGIVVMHAELTALVCSGARRGKQFTYALMDDRAPANEFDREAALASLVRRYFASHGPATTADFAWWSGLTATDAKRALADGIDGLASETVGRATYWFDENVVAPTTSPIARLLPNYDELFIGHRDRSAQGVELRAPAAATRPDVWHHAMFVDGQAVGGWTRASTAKTVTVTTETLRPLTTRESSAFAVESRRLATFMGRTLAE